MDQVSSPEYDKSKLDPLDEDELAELAAEKERREAETELFDSENEDDPELVAKRQRILDGDFTDPEDHQEDELPASPLISPHRHRKAVETDDFVPEDNVIDGGSTPEAQDAAAMKVGNESVKKVVVADPVSGNTEIAYFDNNCEWMLFFASRKIQNRDSKTRVALLNNFVANPVFKMVNYFAPGVRDDPDLKNLQDFLVRTKSKKVKFWKNKYLVASKLKVLVDVLERSDKELEGSKRASAAEPTPIKKFREYVNEIRKRMNADKEVEKVTSKRAVNTKAIRTVNDETLQDELVRSDPKWWKRIETGRKCPACNHGFLVPVIPFDEIEKQTKQLREEYEEKKRNADKKEKVCIPTYPKQVYMYMCRVNTCRDVELGTGCKQCEDRHKLGLPSLFDGVKGVCLCEICQCECEIAFNSKKWLNIFHQTNEKTIKKERANAEAAKGCGKFAYVRVYLYVLYCIVLISNVPSQSISGDVRSMLDTLTKTPSTFFDAQVKAYQSLTGDIGAVVNPY